MASGTIAAKASIVDVVVMVTTDTFRVLFVRGAIPVMAIPAQQFAVGRSQDKTGLAVIEAPTAPGVRVVACLAVFVEGAIMRVFALVAAGTVTVCSGEIFIFVAAFTQRQPVHAEKRERGQVMMKPVSLRPACLFMAVLTPSSGAAVYILFLVTFGAAGPLLPALTGDVARLAR